MPGPSTATPPSAYRTRGFGAPATAGCSFTWFHPNRAFVEGNEIMNRHKKFLTIFLLSTFVLLSGLYLVRADRTNTRSTIVKARGLAKKRKCPEAVALLEKVFKETEDTELLLALADVYTKMKQKDKAVRTLDDLIERIRDQASASLYDRDLYKKARVKLNKLCPNRKILWKINDKIIIH